MGGFVIKYKELRDLSQEFKSNIDILIWQLEYLENVVMDFVNLDKDHFDGEGADASKAYFNDVHIKMINLIKCAAQSLQDDIAIYKSEFAVIDLGTNFILSKEEIKKYKRELKKCGEKLCIGTDKKGSLESVLNKELSKISDIYEGIFPAILVGHIIGCHDKLDAIMNNLIDRTEGLEEGIIGLVENNADSLIDDIGKTNNAIGVDWQGMKEYTQGGIYSNTDMQSACVNGEINSNFHNNNKEYVDEVWKREAELIKKAEEREEGGYWKILNGFLEIGGGIKTIVVSHGSCLFLGLSEIGMGVSNWSEGMDDIYYGSQGDITSKSTNYGRSIVCYFGGDYETYSMLENAVVFASSAFSPIYSQYKTGQLTTRSFLTAVGKEAISTEAGNIASGIVYDATDNRTLSMLAGMTTSNLTSKGLCNLDKKYGWSFGKVADTSTPLEGMKGSDDSKLDADVGDVEVGAKKNTQDVENNVGQEYNNSGSGFSKTSYGKSSLIELKNTDNFMDSTIEHIFEGNVRRGKAGGYHYECIKDTAGNIVNGTEVSINDLGVYKAQVEVNGIPKSGNGGYSTFFPKEMSPQDVIDSINEAYNNKVFVVGSKNSYIGTSNNGLEIEMYINKNGKIISAFPKE